jgi:hypothetical protein
VTCKLLPPGALQVERLPDGRRRLLRDLNLRLGGEEISIPAGFDTDYSSWPRFLPGPNYSKIDVAGIVHDFIFRYGWLGVEGRDVSYIEANRIWYEIAKSGDDWTKCPLVWALLGRAGLFLGSWPVWLRYRMAD